MPIVAIDPGSTESAFVVWDGVAILRFGKIPNEFVIANLHSPGTAFCDADYCVIEQIRGFGFTAGNELFDTCIITGRFMEAFGPLQTELMPRKTAVTHLCGTSKGGDKDVREAIIYRFGGKEKAIGSKRKPGLLYGIAGDTWAALAVAICWWDRAKSEGTVA